MAKRFVFRLEALRRLREAAEQKQQRVVAECLRRVQSCVTELEDLKLQLSETLNHARRTRGERRIDARMELQEQRWRAYLQRRMESKTGEQETLEQSLADARQTLTARSRDVKVIEKLRERRLEAYTQNLRRADRVESDELATQMFIRRRQEAQELNAPW